MTEQELHEKLYPEAAAKPEYIICAAIHFRDGITYPHQPKNIESGIVVCGRRHHNCFVVWSKLSGKDFEGNEVQGFLTSKDRFIDRKEAAELALQRGQVSRHAKVLFSEDLY